MLAHLIGLIALGPTLLTGTHSRIDSTTVTAQTVTALAPIETQTTMLGMIRPRRRPKLAKLEFPPLPAGVSSPFSDHVYAVEEKIVNGDFQAADELIARMPKRHLKYIWDDHKLSREARFEYASSRDSAFSVMRHGIEMDYANATSPAEADFKITFEPVLGDDPVSHQPRAVTTFYHPEPGQPPFEIVIGLKRANTPEATAEDVYNDIAYGLGTYLGVAKNKFPGAALSRTDAPAVRKVTGSNFEWLIIESNMEVLDALRDLITHKVKVTGEPGPSNTLVSPKPNIFVDPLVLAPTESNVQGKPYVFNIQLTNRGTARLLTKLIPDCGCFSRSEPIALKPGDSGIYQVVMNTAEYNSAVNKELYLLSNDPERPIINIPVHVNLLPRYRFLTPDGSVLVVNSESGRLDVILAVEGGPLEITSARTEGAVSGEVQFEPWSGVLPDPELKRPAARRSGYRLIVNVGENLMNGRQPFALAVSTGDKDFPIIRTTLFVQKGIAAIPDQIFAGHLAKSEFFKLALSRPHKPFHILKVQTTNPHFTAVYTKTQVGTDHDITVKYDGLGSGGDFTAFVIITTNDPHQKKIKVPITGTIQ